MIDPIVRRIPALYGSEPGPTSRRIGADLMGTAFAATPVTSSMFATTQAPNLLAVGLIRGETGLDITLEIDPAITAGRSVPERRRRGRG